MKKVLALVLALVMMLCAASALAEDAVNYLGMGMYTSLSSSKDATADQDGTAQADVYAASVVVDANGTIVLACLDVTQAKVSFSAAGLLTTDVATTLPQSKIELGEAYGMKAASPIGLEYNEQMVGLENWLVGKTVEDLKTAYAGSDETLTAVATVHLDGVIAALEKAVANALPQ